MKNYKPKIFRLTPFPVEVLYFCCKNKATVAEYLYKKYKCGELLNREWLNCVLQGRTMVIPGHTSIVIWVNKKDIPLIVHEVIHAINMAEQIVGQFYLNNCDETQAYLAEYMMREILND